MAEILPGVHQVEGVDPSPDFTTHVYLVKDKGSGWTLIDAGLPDAHAAVLAYLARQKIDPKSVNRILVTHLHLDHTGSLAHLAKATGARTFAHWVEAAYIAMNPPYDGPGAHPQHPFQVDELLKDGDQLDAGGGLTVYHTPGHTPGHTSYYQAEKKILFCGDLFMANGSGRMGLTVPEYTHHTPTAKISARRVSSLPVEAILTYHGGPFLTDAAAQLKRVVQGL